MKRFFLSCLVVLLAQVAFAQEAKTPADICASAVPAADPTTRSYAQAEQVLEPGVDYQAVFCTDAGAIYVDLLEDYSPQAVNNFVFLAEQGYYNNTTFHRVIADFMAQGGDPTATGTGGPGYSFSDEFTGFLNFNAPGVLAMANAGPNTNGSQFFITTAAAPHLNYNPSQGVGYTIFGEVLEGQSTVNSIQLRDPAAATEPGTALNTVVIVTDPTIVTTTFEPPASATRDEIAAVIDNVSSQIPPSLLVDSHVTGISDAELVAQTAPEALVDDYADFLAQHDFDYRAEHRVTNGQCDLQSVPYIAISYTLDRFATPEDAAAALEDGFLDELAAAQGYSASSVEGMAYPVYTATETACDVPATAALAFWQRGHFIATAQVVFPSSSSASADLWLNRLVAIVYEGLFSDVLHPEIHAGG